MRNLVVGVALTAASAILAGTAEASAPRAPAAEPWHVVSISRPRLKPDDGPAAVVRFANGFSFKPGLYAPAVIGRLPSTTVAPFVVVEGSGCSECDATARSVYIGDPTHWPVYPDRENGVWFAPYPSRNYSATSGRLMTWSRLFVGKCLPGGSPAVVSFAAVREGGRWNMTVDWARSEGRRLKVTSAKSGSPNAPSLAAVLRSSRDGGCHEVPQQTTDEGDF